MASEYANHWSPTLKLSVLCTKSSIGVKSVTRPSTTWARPDARTSCSRANSRYVSTKLKMVMTPFLRAVPHHAGPRRHSADNEYRHDGEDQHYGREPPRSVPDGVDVKNDFVMHGYSGYGASRKVDRAISVTVIVRRPPTSRTKPHQRRVSDRVQTQRDILRFSRVEFV